MIEFDSEERLPLSLIRQIDQLSDEFETACRTDSPPSLGEFTPRIDSQAWPCLLREIVNTEVDHWRSLGIDDPVAKVRARNHEFSFSAFEEVLRELADGEAGGAERSRRERSSTDGAPNDSARLVGPFELVESLGEGGMGEVWLAEQRQPVRRRVAVKLIRSGINRRQLAARFEAERQALAVMNHPNIAKFLDVGTTKDGQPYYVMELVEGVPLTQFCDTRKLTIEERLELFVSVCLAVQHAHQRGIIHRDLKPGNVLVTEVDGKPVPKVIDFGLAKALESHERLNDHTFHTTFNQVLGTLQYISPEQACLEAAEADTRSDVYSLGAMLYEIVTGTTPLEREVLRGQSLLQTLQYIREQEIPRASARWASLRERASTAEPEPRLESARLENQFREDLDWILARALDKVPARRYQSPQDLAEEITRYLDHEPIEARPPSFGYRLQKFTYKNKAAIVTVLLVIASLAVGLVGTTWQTYRARAAERTAVANADKANQNLRQARQTVDQFLTLVSENMLLREEGMLPLREELLQMAVGYYQDFTDQNPEDATVQAELAATYCRLAMTKYARHSVGWVESFSQGLDILEKLLAENVSASCFESYTQGNLILEDVSADQFKQPDKAEDILQRGSQILSALSHTYAGVAAFDHDAAMCHLLLGERFLLNNRSAALRHFHVARKTWRRLMENDGAKQEYARGYAHSTRELYRKAHPDKQLKLRQQAIGAFRQHYGNFQPQLADMLRMNATYEPEQGLSDCREAIAIYRNSIETNMATPRSLPELRWNYGQAQRDLAGLLQIRGERAAAVRECRLAKEIHQTLHQQNPLNDAYLISLAKTVLRLGNLHRDRGEHLPAADEYIQAVRLLTYETDEIPFGVDLGLALAYLEAEMLAAQRESVDRGLQFEYEMPSGFELSADAMVTWCRRCQRSFDFRKFGWLEQIAHFGRYPDSRILPALLWHFLLAPDALPYAHRLLALTEFAGGQCGECHKELLRGAALYRGDRHEKAAEVLGQLIDNWDEGSPEAVNVSKAAALYFLAMSYRKSGRTADAQNCLVAAVREADRELQKKSPWNWHSTMQLDLLRGEATSLLNESSVTKR